MSKAKDLDKSESSAALPRSPNPGEIVLREMIEFVRTQVEARTLLGEAVEAYAIGYAERNYAAPPPSLSSSPSAGAPEPSAFTSSPDQCLACGNRGLSMDRLGGACHALECSDPTAWLRAQEAAPAPPPESAAAASVGASAEERAGAVLAAIEGLSRSEERHKLSAVGGIIADAIRSAEASALARARELEKALRDALGWSGHHEQNGMHWIASEQFTPEECPCRALAAGEVGKS